MKTRKFNKKHYAKRNRRSSNGFWKEHINLMYAKT